MTLIYGRIIIINNNINSKAFPYNGTHSQDEKINKGVVRKGRVGFSQGKKRRRGRPRTQGNITDETRRKRKAYRKTHNTNLSNFFSLPTNKAETQKRFLFIFFCPTTNNHNKRSKATIMAFCLDWIREYQVASHIFSLLRKRHTHKHIKSIECKADLT